MGIGNGWSNSLQIDNTGNASLPGNMTAEKLITTSPSAATSSFSNFAILDNDEIKYRSKTDIQSDLKIPVVVTVSYYIEENRYSCSATFSTISNYLNNDRPVIVEYQEYTYTSSGGSYSRYNASSYSAASYSDSYNARTLLTYRDYYYPTYKGSSYITFTQTSGGHINQIKISSSDKITYSYNTNYLGKPYINSTTTDANYYLIGSLTTSGYGSVYSALNASGTANTSGVYFNGSTGVLYGAAWNDYAEYRTQTKEIEPGYCVASTNNGEVYKTTEKFQACDGIVSDTFGFAIGETDNCKTPLAVAGRVLAYCEGDRYDYNAGDTVCAGPNGKVCKMTREEIKEWPDRIVGIVSEIPDYEEWGPGNSKIKVNNRIWIKIK